jgi:hypothetical protein
LVTSTSPKSSQPYANRQVAWSGLFHPPPFDFRFAVEI